MKKLWLTYAWKDNEDQNLDYIVQELDKLDLEVKFDRRNLVPGQRLWDQIGKQITDPDQCEAWGILLTSNSLKSGPCIEELAYALDRALEAKGEHFPMFALMTDSITSKDLPPSLKVRLCIPLTNNDWKDQVESACHKRPTGFTPQGLSDFVLTEHIADNGFCLEMRPRFDKIAPVAVAVDFDEKESGNVFASSLGPAGIIPTGYVAHSRIDSETTLTDGTKAWVWGADNETNSTYSYFLFYKSRPKRIWFGHQQNLSLINLK
ncbi:hypothetical protein ES708_11351 [subsurface metagenome]